ncbi:hypothetical protein C9374_001599 [Naegleria lovaniensis]|uniref:Glycerate kinase n=1 Tax=Naegleria lovaniensis TaxID=51637 RepID=A0AA88KRE9_NAELO|nr:uncharacterized protein C9374_001599 [Naegleria lovaniensis]KAG2387267.1 hypothetical protein C9374_001599 [Naegleria lovaniensis]
MQHRCFKVLTCFDKFKDSLKSRECGEAIALAFQGAAQSQQFQSQFMNIPLSDGGEGFLESIKQNHPNDYQLEFFPVRHPLHSRRHELVPAPYYYKKHIHDNELNTQEHIYVLEMATVCGLEQLRTEERNPFETTTYPLGLLIKHILLKHNENDNIHILLGIGGSCTNDAGIGCLSALGCIKDFVFLDNYNSNDNNNTDFQDNLENSFVFYGKHLVHLADFTLDRNALPYRYRDLTIDIACDVNNPLVGERGATFTFSKQKGVKSPQDREILEKGMIRFAQLVRDKTGVEIADMPGAGAAGGISGGFYSILHGKVELKKGIEMIGMSCQLEKHITDADIVFTGEGCYDDQSEGGKVVSWVSKLCQQYNKACIICCGQKKKETVPNENCLLLDLTSQFPMEKSMKETFSCLAQLTKEKLPLIFKHVDRVKERTQTNQF